MTDKRHKKDDKGRDERVLSERYGQKKTGPALHPEEKEFGIKGASNAGEDETSGSE